MSDETPTERFDAAGSDTPTEKIEAPAATLPLEVAEKGRSRRQIVILAAIGAALLVALLIVLILLLTRGGAPSALATSSATPTITSTPTVTASTTPSATAEPTPTATQTVAPPPSTDASVDSFSINPTTVDCSGASSVVITLKWSTSNANNVYFGVDTNDAQAAPFFGDSLPASGTSTNDFPNGYRPFEYTCGNGSHTYAITAVSADGSQKDTSTVTVTG